MKLITLIVACAITLRPDGAVAQQLTPEVTSWILNTTGATGYAGISADVQQVQYSASYVYVHCTDIPDYSIGPWPGNPNTPSNQNFVYKIARSPQANAGTPTAAPLGHIGVLINGVSIFNALDARSYNNQNIWHQNAETVEGPSFDACGGHPAPGGEYHHHVPSKCLIQDDSTRHSPVVGFAFDGYNGSYQRADTLAPFGGYWVKLDRDGQLILNTHALAGTAGRIRIVDKGEPPPRAEHP